MKQIIIVRQDLKMSKGKLAGQVAHAAIGAPQLLPQHQIDRWIKEFNQKKIILKVIDEESFNYYFTICVKENLKPYIVVNTTKDRWYDMSTCFGVGPYEDEKLDEIFKDLKLL